MFTRAFWKATIERAIKTFAQTTGSALGVGVVGSALNIASMPWNIALLMGAGATALSVLTSLGSTAYNGGGPSATNAEKLS